MDKPLTDGASPIGDRAVVNGAASVSAVPASVPSASEPEWKGGYDQASWMGRYAERMMQAGFKPYEAECWAFNAWEASPDDADPDDTASDDLAYASEDSL